MYIRTTTFTYDSAQEESLLRLTDEQLLSAYRQLPGFVSFTSGLERTAQRGVSVTIWDSMDHAAGARAALGSIIQQFEAIGVRFEPAQVYELVRQV